MDTSTGGKSNAAASMPRFEIEQLRAFLAKACPLPRVAGQRRSEIDEALVRTAINALPRLLDAAEEQHRRGSRRPSSRRSSRPPPPRVRSIRSS